jgi:predicted transposase/invertase (TIGR01784 family)
MNHAHDPFVRNFVAELKNARDLIRSSFPEELVSILSLDQLELTKDSFLSKKLKESRSDLLFKVPLKNSDSHVYIYILFEHKSYYDKKIYTQLLGYLSKIYSKQMKNKEKVSIVIPFVFYHGKKGWDLGLEFLDGFQKIHIPDVLIKYIPNFSIQLLELKNDGKEFETDNLTLRLYMRIIQIIRDKPELFKKNLKKIYSSLQEEKEIANQIEIFETIVEYIHLARKDAEEFTNKEILSEFEENYMNLLERKKQEGIQIGEERGIEKGEFQKAIQTARKMRDLGLAIDIIEKSVGLTERELKDNGF